MEEMTQEVTVLGYLLKHSLFAVFTVGLGLYFFVKAFSMPSTAAHFPTIIASLVFLLSASMVVEALRKVRRGGGVPGSEAADGKILVTRVVSYVALTAAYIFLIPRIGYFVATPLFMIISYSYFRALGTFKVLLVSIGFSIFIYLLFVWFLKLPIPMGLLEPFFES